MRIKIAPFVAALVILAFANKVSVSGEENTGSSGIELIGVHEFAGDSNDLSGLDQPLVTVVENISESNDESPAMDGFRGNQFGGISAVAWTGDSDTYWFLPDRGPLDGAVDWSCRVHKIRITVNADDSAEPLSHEFLETVMLKDELSRPFTGLASAFRKTSQRSRRFDPEGIRVLSNGNLIVSDEYGPRLIEFTTSGDFVKELKAPSHLLIDSPGVSKPAENPKNSTGRQTNRGMEGLALTVDGNSLVGLMQSPLLQDSFRKDINAKPKGLNCRMPLMDMRGELEKELLYHLDDNGNKLNEILNCGPDRYLVIERDGEPGEDAEYKKVMLVSTANASDISGIETLPQKEIPAGVNPVSKSVLIDLLDPKWNLSGDSMPEKIESLAFGPDIDAGHRLLLVASDNDFEPKNATLVYAFSVPKTLLELEK